MLEIAKIFGEALDKDDFDRAKELLTEDCQYLIGKDVLVGPEAICGSYEQNMIEGRKKLDQLEWGTSRIEQLNDLEFYVHFTDFLTHNGVQYVHKCKQKLSLQDEKIVRIEHIDDAEEQKRLDAYYRTVGLK